MERFENKRLSTMYDANLNIATAWETIKPKTIQVIEITILM